MGRNFKTIILLVLIWTAAVNAASGQQAILTGKVIEAVGVDSPIVGAAVVIEGTSIGTLTSVDGGFTLTGIPAGPFRLSVSNISYRTVYLDIDPSKITGELVIELEPDNVNVDNITVRGRRRNNTESGILSTMRELSVVTSGISASQIAKSADRDASQIVKRIPGVTILDDRFIIVRGLSQRYNNAWINGQAMPSTEADSRSFSFDLIPSGQIDNIIIYKSPAPEIPADFAGGFVKITTKSVPDVNTFGIGYATGFNFKTQFKDFYINPGPWTEALGFDVSKRPLSGSFPANLGTVSDPDRLTDLYQNGFNNDWSIKKRTPLPDQKFTFDIARRIPLRAGNTLGNITSLNYSNSSRTVENIKNTRYGIYSATADKSIIADDYIDNQYTRDVRLGAMHNWSLETADGSSYQFRNLLNVLGRNRLTERSGIKELSSMYYREETEMLYTSRLTYSGQVSGSHNPSERSHLEWNAGYSFASRNEPDRRIVVNQEGIGSVADIENVVVSNESIKRYYQKLHDHVTSGSVDYSVKLGSGSIIPKLKAGAYAFYQSRDYTPREFIYRTENLPKADRDSYLLLPLEQMMQRQYLGADKVTVEELSRKSYAYTAKVHHQALYGAIDLPLGRWNIYAGARMENYVVNLERDKSGSPDIVIKDKKKHSNLDILPSANITYRISEDHLLRGAYGRSLNRPELREVSPATYYDFDLFSEIIGNENLKTAYIHNADLRYEYYPSRGEIISLGVFYKNFKNPIEWTYIDMGGSLRYTYENARSAVNYGAEVDVRKNFDFAGLPDLSLVVNAAWIKSNIKFRDKEMGRTNDRAMQGQSPYVVNAGLYYQSRKLGLSASVLYNRVGKRIVGIGRSSSAVTDVNSIIPDSYEMPRDVLDASVSKTFGRNWELKLSVHDILSQDVVYKQFPLFKLDDVQHKREQVTRRFNPGPSFQIGINFKM